MWLKMYCALKKIALIRSDLLYQELICNSSSQYTPYQEGTLPHLLHRKVQKHFCYRQGKKSSCLKYVKVNAYLVLNGESETAFFASIKLSYSLALEEKIFIIIDYCLHCTVCNTSEIILIFGGFLFHSNTRRFCQFCLVIIHTDA